MGEAQPRLGWRLNALIAVRTAVVALGGAGTTWVCFERGVVWDGIVAALAYFLVLLAFTRLLLQALGAWARRRGAPPPDGPG